MLKRDITYEDFDGQQVTETFYFNISKTELVEMEVEYSEGFSSMIQGIIKSEDNKALFGEFKKLVLAAYGTKSEDGKRFIKSDKLKEEFSQTAAFDALIMDLASNEGVAAAFVTGVFPRDVAMQVANQLTPPAAPVPPVSVPSV